MNYNEIHTYNNLIKISALSSGYHIGSSNWLIEVGTFKIAILGQSSLEGEYRHPKQFNSQDLKHVDVLLVGSVVN